MKLRLKSRTAVPYGGNWRTHDRLSGFKVEAYQVDLVIERLKEHRKANGLPIGREFEDEVERWLCEDHPEECEVYDPNLPPRLRNSLSLGDVVHGTSVMIAHALSGWKLVDEAEANRRAAQCAGCRFNTNLTSPCGGLCSELKVLVEKIIGAKRTHFYHELKSCSLCGCFTESAVWLPLDTQVKALSAEQKNQFKAVGCWKAQHASIIGDSQFRSQPID